MFAEWAVDGGRVWLITQEFQRRDSVIVVALFLFGNGDGHPMLVSIRFGDLYGYSLSDGVGQ